MRTTNELGEGFEEQIAVKEAKLRCLNGKSTGRVSPFQHAVYKYVR